MEVLDTEANGRPRSDRRGRRRTLWIALPVAVVVLVVTAFAVVSRQAGPPRDPPFPEPSTSGPAPTADPAPEVWAIDPFLPDLDVDVFARNTDSVFRIDTGHGRVTATRVGPIEDSPEVLRSFVASRGQVIVHSMGFENSTVDGVGYVVPDDGAARPLPSRLQQVAAIAPAGARRLWSVRASDTGWTVGLSDLTGTPLPGRRQTRFTGAYYVQGDGVDSLLILDDRGVVALRPDGSQHRVTSGTLVATGASAYLIEECGNDDRCRRYLVPRVGGSRRSAGTGGPSAALNGRLSDDARYLATYVAAAEEVPLEVTDLRTGKRLLRHVDPVPTPNPQSLIWLPTNRLLYLDDGRLTAFDPATGRSARPDLKIPRLTQLALRP